MNSFSKMIEDIKDMKLFMPYYPRGIADSWDQNDKLGDELLRVLNISQTVTLEYSKFPFRT